MEIRPIPDVVRSALRSGSNLLTIPHCINELIYNAIDAEAKCVEIRVDLSDFQFQVIDDGNGISKLDLNLIGTRYMSSKCYNLSDYTNNSKYYGFRGETLCSLISVCQSVTIHTRLKNSDETYRKCFVNGFNSNNIENDSISRPSHGTSVIVNGWMKNLPVRQKQVSPIFDMVEIKTQIEKIALINPSISFSLRNNSNKHLMLSIRRCNNILNSINLIIGKDITANLKYVNFEHGNVKISGYISGKALPKCDVQLIYLNRRFIKRSRIHKYLRGVFSNCDLLSENPVYFLHFECPYAEFEMVYKESSIRIVFKHPEKVLKYTDKTVIKLLTDENLMNKIDKKSSNSVRGSENCSRIGITQFDTILKSKIATKSSETSKKLVSHSQVELNTDYQSSIVVINKNIDYRQQYVENLTNSQKTQEKAQITDDDVFKTPTVPPLRKSITKRTSKFQKDYTQPFQNKLNTQSTMKTYDSHAKNFQNRSKTKKIIPVYTAAGTSSIEDMTPKTKVSKWLNNLEQGNDNNLVKDSENNQVQIKPKRIIKRRRSIDICEKENTDGPLDFQMQVDSINNENYNIRDTKGADMSSKKIKVFNDNTRFSANNSKIHSKNEFTPMEKSLRNQENSFEISFRFNSDQIERKFYSSDDKSEIEIITPKPPNFHRQTNNNISKNQADITTSSKNFQIQHAFENHTRNNATLIDLSTPINCNQLVKAKKMEEKSELNFNFTPYPAEIPKLFDSLSDSFKFVMPQSILNESIVKPTSVTIASKHSSYHYQEVPKDTNFEENSHNNSFILNNYFDQYAQANSNSVLENPIQDDIVSDVNEIEFEKGLDNIITSTAKTSCSKKESEQKFQLIQRLDVIPKGMSQIYDDTNTCICRHLSPRTKKELLQKIKRKYEQKLNFDRDLESYGQIFDKRFGGIRQKIQISMTKKSKISRTYSFSKSMFNKLKILSQIDKKFIATFLEPTFTENGILILFDQHAVHERIRLERLLKDYEKLPGISKATKLDNILIFNLDSNKKEIMKNFRVNFENHGFIYTITDDSVNIISIPTCIFNKSCREKNSNRNNLMATLTMTLINELIDFCLDTNGVTNFFPQTVLTIINSEACRGATKFGDELSLDECKLYIHQLSKCSLPFQCAHGRPTLVPIFEVNSIKKNYKVMKINFQNIMKQK